MPYKTFLMLMEIFIKGYEGISSNNGKKIYQIYQTKYSIHQGTIQV